MNKVCLTIAAALLVVLKAGITFSQTDDLESPPHVYNYTFNESIPRATDNVYVDVYPTELYIGDPIYIVYYAKTPEKYATQATSFASIALSEFNCRERQFYSGLANYDWLDQSIVLRTLDSVNGASYDCYKEIGRDKRADFERETGGMPFWGTEFLPDELYPPNSKRVLNLTYLETPPLEDYVSSFWENLRNSATSEGVVVEMTLPAGKAVKLRFKPRPNDEDERLKAWMVRLSQDSYPTISAPFYIARDSYRFDFNTPVSLENVVRYKEPRQTRSPDGRERFQIGDETYCSGWFLHLGARKFPRENRLLGLKTIRELEESLAPSALRDEIQFIRMKMEVYAAPNPKARDDAIRFLVDWLFTLPPTQRVVMMRSNPECQLGHKCSPPPWYREVERKLRSFSDSEALKEVE